MNEEQILNYLWEHRQATVGTRQSLDAARNLERKGRIVRVGSISGRPVYRLPARIFKNAHPSGLKQGAKAVLHHVQDYSSALRAEKVHPLANLFGPPVTRKAKRKQKHKGMHIHTASGQQFVIIKGNAYRIG